MSIFRRLLRADPQEDFSKGQIAFEHKNYKSALKAFEKASKRFDNLEMKLLALDNAAVSAEKAKMFDQASELYYEVLLLKLHEEYSTKEILQELDRVIYSQQLSKSPSISYNKLVYMKLLILLAEKEFDKLDSFYNRLKIKDSDEYTNAITETWNLIYSVDTLEFNASLPDIDLPEAFSYYKNTAERIMQRFGLCTIVLQNNETDIIQKGSEFSITALLTAHAALSIVEINLKTGTRGRLLSSSLPDLPLNLSSGENYSIVFTILPNLPGDWTLGPLSIQYSIPSEGSSNFPFSSESISIKVEEATPALKLFIEYETIEEDLEYLLIVKAENNGKTALQNVKILLEIPEGVEIKEGTPEKYISMLGEGETFEYETIIRFALNQTHFDGHIIRASGFIEEIRKLAKSAIKLGG